MTFDARHLVPRFVRLVDSFDALLNSTFDDSCNAVCQERRLDGDFDEVVRLLDVGDGVTRIDEGDLEALPVGDAGARAVAALLGDLRGLRDAGHEPELNCVGEYARDDDELVPVDVYSFHVDSATVPTDTFLCCYSGAPSEGLCRSDARRRVDVPEIRSALLARFGGAGDAEFDAYLCERHLDLHFVPKPDARPFALGRGNLWRLAVEFPGAPVPAFIHRAPRTRPGDGPRLLLIS